MESKDEREKKAKEDAWDLYERGEPVKAAAMLGSIRGNNWPDYRDVVRSVLRVFKHRLVEYIIAPYLEQSQVSPIVTNAVPHL
jgi:formylglycine-generating enzyme required for sulfatase activity